jgi:ribonuclease P protein component
VTRNAVRRRLREVFYSTLAEVPGSWDLVVSARPPAADASLQELSEEFARSLRKLGETGKVRVK